MSKKNTTNVTPESEQVEQLLQAAQDEVLLNLSVDSHMAKVAPDYLQSDLDHRFQALRSRHSSAPRQSPAKQKQQLRQPEIDADHVDQELRTVLGDDLSARFAVLKASLSSPSSANGNIKKDEAVAGSSQSDGYDRVGATQDREGGDDEVEKVIRWAMDTARLDPSPPSEEEDDEHDQEDTDDSDDDYCNHRKSKSKTATPKSSRGN